MIASSDRGLYPSNPDRAFSAPARARIPAAAVLRPDANTRPDRRLKTNMTRLRSRTEPTRSDSAANSCSTAFVSAAPFSGTPIMSATRLIFCRTPSLVAGFGIFAKGTDASSSTFMTSGGPAFSIARIIDGPSDNTPSAESARIYPTFGFSFSRFSGNTLDVSTAMIRSARPSACRVSDTDPPTETTRIRSFAAITGMGSVSAASACDAKTFVCSVLARNARQMLSTEKRNLSVRVIPSYPLI